MGELAELEDSFAARWSSVVGSGNEIEVEVRKWGSSRLGLVSGNNSERKSGKNFKNR